MTGLLLAALLLSAAFGLAAPPLSRRLPPVLALWLLSAGAVVAAGAAAAALALLSFLSIAPSPVVAARAHWSATVLHGHGQPPLLLGLVAGLLLVGLGVRTARALLLRAGALRAAYRLAAELPPTELCVLDSECCEAFAVPGRPGRIVATTGLLRSLDADQRLAVLAHERSHLTHRHHWHQSLTALACAANPLLSRLQPALALACERQADHAAASCSSRAAVATALTRLAGHGTARQLRPSVVLAVAAQHVAARVAELTAPPSRPQLWRVAVLTGLLVAAAASVAVAMRDTEHLYEIAQAAYRARRHLG